LTSVSLQAAVPKTQRLQLQPISASEINVGGEATQMLRVVGVNGPPPARLRLRLKIGHATGVDALETAQVDWAEPA